MHHVQKPVQWPSHLVLHRRSTHEGVKYSCDQWYTLVITRPRYDLGWYKRSVHEHIRYFCSQCNFSNTTPSDLIIHINITQEGIKYECNKCDNKVKNKFTII